MLNERSYWMERATQRVTHLWGKFRTGKSTVSGCQGLGRQVLEGHAFPVGVMKVGCRDSCTSP